MLSNDLQNAINYQINREIYSAYLYLSMSAYFESNNLPGFAHWMRVQQQEEMLHAMKLFDFVNDMQGRVVLQAIEQPAVDFASPMDAIQQTVEHERRVTKSIDELYEIAIREREYASQVLLQWFITEQVEEEKSAEVILEHLKRIGNDGTGLLILDERLGARTAAG